MMNDELVTRRSVIEQYVQNDARKKNMAVPSGMNEWDWSSADDLDRRLEAAKFKYGIITGYTFWKPVELDYRDLSKCAIFNGIFQSLPRGLGQLVGSPQFEAWKPDRQTEWYERLDGLGDYPREWPLILRPTVSSELPAEWYIEDGSGRAICFFRRLSRSADCTSRAYGYRGVHPDPHSTFMRTKFAELLRIK